MDVLTHLFLPVTVAYAVRPDLFPSPRYFALAGFAVLPDFEELLGTPGLLHSLFAVGAVGAAAALVERRVTGSRTYATLAVLLMGSHLLLDVLDGGPVTLLYPVVETGVGLTYPTRIAFGDAVHEVAVRRPVPDVRVAAPDASRAAYPLVNGYGVPSVVAFLTT